MFNFIDDRRIAISCLSIKVERKTKNFLYIDLVKTYLLLKLYLAKFQN